MDVPPALILCQILDPTGAQEIFTHQARLSLSSTLNLQPFGLDARAFREH